MSTANAVISEDIGEEKLVEQIPENVISKYAREQEIGDLNIAKLHHLELVRFLTLSNNSRRPCVPSRSIDALWHNFILHTKEYEKFCYKYFGGFIHHTPGTKETDRKHMMQLYLETRARLQARFGALNEDIWPDLSNKLARLNKEADSVDGDCMAGDCMSNCCMRECH